MRPSVPFLALFYIPMGALAYALSAWILDRNLFDNFLEGDTNLMIALLSGAGLGITSVGLSRVLEWKFTWARNLSKALKEMLGPLSHIEIIAWACFSSIGEEMFFRGFLLPATGLIISSLIFAMMHYAPGKEFRAWAPMALFMGLAFGGLYTYTGSILAPVLAHFTINFFNLHTLVGPNVKLDKEVENG